MDIEKIWNERSWTKQARDIITNIRKFPEDAKVILILRHSQRNEPKKFSVNADLNLTPQGRKIAYLFGSNLPKNRSIRVFHSDAERCQDTAKEIFNGFKEIGGEAVLKGSFKPLSHIGIPVKSFFKENEKYEILELFYRWVAGVYSPTLWTPLITYSQNAGVQMLEKIDNAPEKTLDIHVTHDLHLMALRLGWFGLHPDGRWVDYLGGFVFSLLEDQIKLFEYGEFKPVEYPYWWKNSKLT